MAITKCRECKSEISDSAKVCPKCGIPKPVKKISLMVKLLIGFFVVAALGQVMSLGAGNKPSTSSDTTAKKTSNVEPTNSKPKRLSESELAANVLVTQFSREKGSSESIFIISKITLENKNTEDIKDFTIKCEHVGQSGTVIDRIQKLCIKSCLPPTQPLSTT